MKRWLPLLLLLGAVLGLMGQEAALAQALPVAPTAPASAAVAMDSDCAEMMAAAKKEQPDQPCRGLTFDCIAKMGCAVPFALLPAPAPDASPLVRAALPAQAPAALLVGRDSGPEPHPPTILG